ncbi:MAG: type II toxin-antitoxin system HicA family toxin [Chloroflexota bacterium]
MNYAELTQCLRELGCEFRRAAKGSHELWWHPIRKRYTAIPHHGARDIKIGTLKKILRDLGIGTDEWNRSQVGKLKEIRETYSANIDPAQLECEPIILERDGRQVGAVISIEEYQSYLAWKNRAEATEDFPPEWYVEKAAFERMLPELLQAYRGKFVAIYQGKVVDSDDKMGELIWRVERKLGDKSFYVDEVLETPRVYRIPSVWIRHP